MSHWGLLDSGILVSDWIKYQLEKGIVTFYPEGRGKGRGNGPFMVLDGSFAIELSIFLILLIVFSYLLKFSVFIYVYIFFEIACLAIKTRCLDISCQTVFFSE